MIRIGSWLKEKRTEAGKSQLECALETYVSIDTLRKIEQGSIYPRTNHFEKLCLFFGVTPSDYYNEQATSRNIKPSEALPPFPPEKRKAPNSQD